MFLPYMVMVMVKVMVIYSALLVRVLQKNSRALLWGFDLPHPRRGGAPAPPTPPASSVRRAHGCGYGYC